MDIKSRILISPLTFHFISFYLYGSRSSSSLSSRTYMYTLLRCSCSLILLWLLVYINVQSIQEFHKQEIQLDYFSTNGIDIRSSDDNNNKRSLKGKATSIINK